jgi:hypothetical protein
MQLQVIESDPVRDRRCCRSVAWLPARPPLSLQFAI